MVATAIILFVLIVDQIIKYLVKTNMQLHDHIDITSWFQILFTENKGMAYGIQWYMVIDDFSANNYYPFVLDTYSNH